MWRTKEFFFSNYTRMAIMQILTSESLLLEKKFQYENVPPAPASEYWTTGPCFWVQHSPFCTTWAIACKAKILGSLCHFLLILNKSSKSKDQVAHKQMFKDLLSSKCSVSGDNMYFVPRFFCFYVVRPLIGIIANFV